MLYQLVLITNLGVITPVATFDQRMECQKEQAMIQKSAQYSTACLPTNSPDQIMRQSQEGLRQMMQMFSQMTREMEKAK